MVLQMTCEASIACSFVPMVLVKTMCLVVCIQVDDCKCDTCMAMTTV